jgi:hypothetical protein
MVIEKVDKVIGYYWRHRIRHGHGAERLLANAEKE